MKGNNKSMYFLQFIECQKERKEKEKQEMLKKYEKRNKSGVVPTTYTRLEPGSWSIQFQSLSTWTNVTICFKTYIMIYFVGEFPISITCLSPPGIELMGIQVPKLSFPTPYLFSFPPNKQGMRLCLLFPFLSSYSHETNNH